MIQGGLVKAGLDVAQLWLDGDETLVYTIDREGVTSPINMISGHAMTHDPLVVLVSIHIYEPHVDFLFNMSGQYQMLNR